MESPSAPARMNDVAADRGPTVFAAYGHHAVGRAPYSDGRPDFAGLGRRVGARPDGIVPAPSNTRAWLAAGVTDLRRGFNTLAAYLSMLLEGINWRMPQRTWRPSQGAFCSKFEAMDQLAFDLQEDIEIAAASEAGKAASTADADQNLPAKRTHNRAPLPDHLERQEEILSPGDACNDCCGALKQLAEGVTEELERTRPFAVKQLVRSRMICTCCEFFAQAELPSRPSTRRRLGPGLLAHMLFGKYYNHLPLFRQSEIYARDKVDLHRSTLTDWLGRSTSLLEPLASHIGKLVRGGSALFADDTPVKMQAKSTAQQRAFGATCAMNVLGAGRLRPASGISSAWTSRVSTLHPISRDTKVWCMPMGSPGSMAYSGQIVAPTSRLAWFMCAANSSISMKARGLPSPRRRSS